MANKEVRSDKSDPDDIDVRIETLTRQVVFETFNNFAAPAPPPDDLRPLQKQLPTTYLAILNAHGDYGYGNNQRAFLAPPPEFTIHDDEKAHFSFPDLPHTATRVVLRGNSSFKPISLDVVRREGTPHVEPIPASQIAQLQFLQVFDNQEVLLAIGMPVNTNPQHHPNDPAFR
jgi:hypothetical protein